MAKSSVRLAVDDTWALLESYGEYMRDTRTVKGFNTGHEGGSQGLDDVTAERVEEAIRWLMLKDDMMCMAVLWHFRGKKIDRRDEGNVPVTYYKSLSFSEIGGEYEKGKTWADSMVTVGVGRLDGWLSR